MGDDGLIQCYNRGCGLKYREKDNNEDSCRHHPGEPVFHDAYKGWSCCNKKCTDFTEFLNIKGCSLSKHSNIKPTEPEKQRTEAPEEIIEVKPLVKTCLDRPPFDTPMVEMKPEVAPSLLQQLKANVGVTVEKKSENSNEVTVGTICKHGGCNVSYEGPQTDASPCLYHSGYPVFHEGLKFWTCCTKRTSDFNAFLNQPGCQSGTHVWIAQESNEQSVQCRWDYHQTGTHMIVSIYAKQYCPDKSEVQLNPIRLYACLVFPQQENAVFKLDFELRGVVDVEKSQVSMYGTKVEIKLKKAEPGSWSKLEIPHEKKEQKSITTKQESVESLETQVESVDLSDL